MGGAVKFLDKESRHLLPGYGKKGQLTGDLLMQWFLFDGKKQHVLAHIEFQQNRVEDFSRRVFLTSVRATELYPDWELAQLAIYTGPEVPSRHNFYEVKFWGGRTLHEFASYIVRDQKRPELEASHNMFALVVLACLVNIEYKRRYKDDLEWLKQQKITLAKLCFQRGYTRYEIENLLILCRLSSLCRAKEKLNIANSFTI